ncbi:hypothetical protein [Haloplanus rubicundus]|nr:hypothetical protein [Haloplanus rubicundus]
MTAVCRQTCTGDRFEHAETVMSIAKANELLRCPICRREVRLSGSAGGN